MLTDMAARRIYGTGSIHGGVITGSGNIFLEKGNIEGVSIHTVTEPTFPIREICPKPSIPADSSGFCGSF